VFAFRKVSAAALAWAIVPMAATLGCELGSSPAPSGSSQPTHSNRESPLRASRIVSINPSLTAILLALGAREAIVGVDDFSAGQQPEVSALPRVGGLFSPSLEAVAALEPDAVVLVPSVEQRDFRERLEAIGIPVVVFANIRFEQVLENIRVLGELVGREEQAAARVHAIRSARAAAQQVSATRPAPRTVLVLQRDPVFIVGAGSFLDELLGWAGAENLGARFDDPYPQVAIEWLVDVAPEVMIDMTPESAEPLEFWSRWPAIPAVASGRVFHLDQVYLPGPYLDRSLRALVATLHGATAAAELAVLLEQSNEASTPSQPSEQSELQPRARVSADG
jgi:ABC-type Fe3+-hydroxamate transport system substrate-binding protein